MHEATITQTEGKSEQVSRRFPAYALGRDPNLRVVACSYSATLALQFSRDVQLIMDEPICPPVSRVNHSRVATKHDAAVQADHFELVRHHGSYRCAGVQGSTAGLPCDVLIVDDPYKDHLEAHSLVVREAVWNNFLSVLLPRLQEGSGVLLWLRAYRNSINKPMTRRGDSNQLTAVLVIPRFRQHAFDGAPLVQPSAGNAKGSRVLIPKNAASPKET